MPAITDFFNSIPPQATHQRVASDMQALPSAQDETQDAQCQQSKSKIDISGPQASAVNGIADNLDIIANADSHEAQSAVKQGDQLQPMKHMECVQPSADRKRQIMADAATHRLVSQQHDNASSDAQLAASHHDPRVDTSNVADEAHISAVIDLVDADDADLPQQIVQPKWQPERQVAGGSQQPSCPICGQAWPAQTSNVRMNQHIDECLRMHLL